MAAVVDVIVDNLVALWSRPPVRKSLPWVFLLISVAGSVAKDLDLVPQTYFSSSGNVLNVYFVKVSWGWTLLLLTPFILLSSSSFSRDVSYIAQRLTSLVVATAVWYVCTQAFLRVENWLGSCSPSDPALAPAPADGLDLSTKSKCVRAGFRWQTGCDISGHSFILSYSALFMAEEMASMASLRRDGLSPLPRTVLKLLYVALNLILVVWVLMFLFTSVYFHSALEKLLGTAFGLSPWYLTYRVWYRRPFSPGLPPQPRPSQDKRHA